MSRKSGCRFSAKDMRQRKTAFLVKHGMTVVDPPGEYYDPSYYAVYFTDPDGMKLEGMVYKPPPKQRRAGKNK